MRLQELISNSSSVDEYIRSAQRQMADHGGGALLIKQPDITEVLELWIEAAKRESVSLKIIIPIRQPTEVYASLKAAGAATSVETGNAFWLKRNLLAERFSRGLPRAFVDYGNFLHNWQREILRISKALNVAVEPDEASIGRFLAPDLHRQRSSTMVNETFGYSWVTRVYAILFGAAQDVEIDIPAMDEIYHAFRACERSFRIASQEFYERLGRITQQSLQRTLEQAPVLRTAAHYCEPSE
jgi:hypothetical protein